jgi:hypothetical protein
MTRVLDVLGSCDNAARCRAGRREPVNLSGHSTREDRTREKTGTVALPGPEIPARTIMVVRRAGSARWTWRRRPSVLCPTRRGSTRSTAATPRPTRSARTCRSGTRGVGERPCAVRHLLSRTAGGGARPHAPRVNRTHTPVPRARSRRTPWRSPLEDRSARDDGSRADGPPASQSPPSAGGPARTPPTVRTYSAQALSIVRAQAPAGSPARGFTGLQHAFPLCGQLST